MLSMVVLGTNLRGGVLQDSVHQCLSDQMSATPLDRIGGNVFGMRCPSAPLCHLANRRQLKILGVGISARGKFRPGESGALWSPHSK
jgi:hypothetical protein